MIMQEVVRHVLLLRSDQDCAGQFNNLIVVGKQLRATYIDVCNSSSG